MKQLTLFPQPPKSPAGGKVFSLHLPIANQNPQMNPSPAIGNTKSAIHGSDAVPHRCAQDDKCCG
jgi:hypothetical protein